MLRGRIPTALVSKGDEQDTLNETKSRTKSNRYGHFGIQFDFDFKKMICPACVVMFTWDLLYSTLEVFRLIQYSESAFSISLLENSYTTRCGCWLIFSRRLHFTQILISNGISLNIRLLVIYKYIHLLNYAHSPPIRKTSSITWLHR